MRRFIFIVLTLIISGCSSEPCDDLRSKANSCHNEAIRSLLLKVANSGDEQECKDYLDSYYFSFSSRCDVSLVDTYGGDSDDIVISDSSDR